MSETIKTFPDAYESLLIFKRLPDKMKVFLRDKNF